MHKELWKKEPMKNKLIAHRFAHWSIAFSIFTAAALLLLTGCETAKTHTGENFPSSIQSSNDVVLREADSLKVTFPGAEQLNTSVTIRRDGKVTLPTIGEVVAAGKTPAQLQKELVQSYSTVLVSSKDISVAVTSSSFPVYVNGAVVKPGKVTTDHPLTVLEAIMEAGGFDYKSAKFNAVKVIRTQNGKTHNYTVNLKGVLKPGSPVDVFYLQPSDIVYVPSKIVWL
jgi:polysaccharide export outer membrane protein